MGNDRSPAQRFRLGVSAAADAADRESEQATEQSSDAHGDTQRYERMPSNLNRRFGRAIFDCMSAGHYRPSNIPHVFSDGFNHGFRELPGGLGRRLG
jgi:hypothetical protein